ncbi:endonuclease/exonuclease/phosphatase family protein [Pedobacter nyackensis]|uniref:endonuclease/exonuclease/phosphatase family protein n=1 Tax=Pedobacter nyackensis TaxID=475255 RepID=UPI00292CBFB8|nr:endonuclease/exonuclease/phosphatase family protein [Pedobacter nyackensis]
MINKIVFFKFLLLAFLFTDATAQEKNLRVLQFNIWQEGTVVPGGFEAIADEIANLSPDLVAFSEVRNYQETRFNERIVAALKARGKTYYSFYSNDSGILSRYPILSAEAINYPAAKGTIHKAIVEIPAHGQLAFYTAHLDYQHAANYLPRGYHGSTWAKLPAPVKNLDTVLKENLGSKRDEAIAAFLSDAKTELKAGRTPIICGDFNEPSRRDWTARNKHDYDHQGLVVPWTTTVTLEKNGFVDAFRKVYPNEITHPGFTFPSFNKDVPINKLIWAADADERDRIDFIFYKKNKKLKPKAAYVVGPNESILKSKPVKETSQDNFIIPKNIWPSDHKAVLIDFEWQ